jgi:predicted negative regulator of RcsB-dependent stress response
MSTAELEIIKSVVDMGGTILVVVMVIGALAVLAWKLIPATLAYRSDTIKVMQQQAQATEKHANAMTQIKDTLQSYITKDNDEHREILLGLQVLAKGMNELTQGLQHDKA